MMGPAKNGRLGAGPNGRGTKFTFVLPNCATAALPDANKAVNLCNGGARTSGNPTLGSGCKNVECLSKTIAETAVVDNPIANRTLQALFARDVRTG